MQFKTGKTTIWVGAAALLLSCGTERPRERVGTASVATFALIADDSDALQLDGCDCQVKNLPNPLACTRVEASVTQSGEPQGICETKEGMKLPIRRFSDMGLFDCIVNADATGVECLDARLENAFAVDIKGRIEKMKQKAMDRLAAHCGSSDGIVEEPPAANPPAEEPPVAAEDVCNPDDARQAFADKLNELLAAAGLDLTYEASDIGSQIEQQIPGLGSITAVWGIPFLQNIGSQNAWCEQDSKNGSPDEFICLGDNGGIGQCGEDQPAPEEQVKAAQERFSRVWGNDDTSYCETTDSLPVGSLGCGNWSGCGSQDAQPFVTCRCAAMTNSIVEKLNCEVPDNCSPAKWRTALQLESAHASVWLNQMAVSNQSLICRGSPLVLDLNGDGLELTSREQGVTFDLSGQSAVQTAWVSGSDDALLAIDRDGNGRIDNGTELFGEADTLLGVRSPNGFAALSVLDDPALGGNGDGMIDANDARFAQLLLWTDANRDGLSETSELRTLEDAGVAAVPLQCISRGDDIDAHGNDLRLRGSFVRTDGTQGSLVDVYFVTGER